MPLITNYGAYNSAPKMKEYYKKTKGVSYAAAT